VLVLQMCTTIPSIILCNSSPWASILPFSILPLVNPPRTTSQTNLLVPETLSQSLWRPKLKMMVIVWDILLLLMKFNRVYFCSKECQVSCYILLLLQ
jgi:hypothetical protein